MFAGHLPLSLARDQGYSHDVPLSLRSPLQLQKGALDLLCRPRVDKGPAAELAYS